MTLPTSLNNYQFSFNGFNFGGTGSPYQIQTVDGLEALPPIRNQDDSRGFNDGSYSGRDFLDGRTVIMTISVFADSTPHSASQNLQTFKNNVISQATGTGYLQFQLGADRSLRWLNARVRKVTTTIDPDYTYGKGQIVVEFFCPDPVMYGGVPGTPTTGSLAIGGTLSITNSGNFMTYPVITITGATAAGLVIANSTLGISITSKYVTTVSDTVIIDLYNKYITFNGVSARAFITNNSLWFGASPGADTFSATGSGAGSISVSWYSAWI